MEDKVNYSLVGAFVLALGAALVAGVLWLAAGVGGRQATDPYQAFIQESVAGLDLQAPVKYLGVDVGKVSGIEIDPQNPQQVRLRLWKQIEWTREQCKTLRVVIPPELWQEDKARLAAKIAATRDARYPEEKERALRWTRR